MNINILTRTKYDEKQLKLIEEIKNEFRLDREVAKLLVSRGIESVEEANKFLFVSNDNLYDPFLLSGMTDIVKRLQLAIANEEKIIVYGDYDADGICSAYILSQGIKALGGDATAYIPNRSEGYGLNIETIDELVEEYFPDLILTCDLGISCHDEVEYIKDLGIDVLVSDHHELPEILPDCPTVNPKIDEGKYPFIDLCGAGVAFKIMQALMPNEFMNYIEFACIATIADSVSLQDENRAIVKMGLAKLNTNPTKQLKVLMEECGIKGEVTTMTVAFIIAPRINASGRMGDASRSLAMFLEEDEKAVKDIVEIINKDNTLRQKYCEEIFLDGAKEFSKNPNRSAVVLSSPNWQTGLLGIVASKLSEEFSKPTILFVEQEGTLRGSGRSILGVNLYEMLSSMTDLFISFGGHAQACGLTILKENFEILQNRIEEYLKNNVARTVYLPTSVYDISETDAKPTLKLLKELNSLEPYGVGNVKPIFMREEREMLLSPMRNYPQHLVGDGEQSNLLAFSQGKYIDVFRSRIKKAVFIDYSINEFKGRESVKGNIKDFYSLFENQSLSSNEMLKEYLFTRTCKNIKG